MENNSNLKTMAERAMEAIVDFDKQQPNLAWPYYRDIVAQLLVKFASSELSLSSPIVPEVVEWHYKRMVGPHSVYELDDLGKRGWELCSSYWENNFLYQIFKRKKQNK